MTVEFIDENGGVRSANHYVLIDDKLQILATVKKIWGERYQSMAIMHLIQKFWPRIRPRTLSLPRSAICSTAIWRPF